MGFITTANTLESIPPALLDRMEVLQIAGYSEEEKLQIAKRYLLPRVLADHGISRKKVKFDSASMREIINGYTREAGLRNFERELATVVRKIAVKIAAGKRGPFTVKPTDMKTYLGPPRFFSSEAAKREVPGVALGLAWTASGGDLLYIEAAKMAGKKSLVLTGRLGDVIKESAQAALSWIRTRETQLGLKENFFDDEDIHIHFPEGATPKDGPSAGITLVAALVSLLTNTPIQPKLAMTGEITLRGKVLPIGGLKEKALAARRAGVKNVIIPIGNIHDLDELQPEVLRDITFHPIEKIEEMLPIAFPKLCAKMGIKQEVEPSSRVKGKTKAMSGRTKAKAPVAKKK